MVLVTILVRHGEPYKREGGIKDGESTSVFYRPETFDVVIYNSTIGEIRMDSWIAMARESGIGMLKKFANTLQRHRDGVLAYYNYKISTGPLEGINNKIKTMNRQAYGFRDMEFFKLKIMAIHETKYALVG